MIDSWKDHIWALRWCLPKNLRKFPMSLHWWVISWLVEMAEYLSRCVGALFHITLCASIAWLDSCELLPLYLKTIMFMIWICRRERTGSNHQETPPLQRRLIPPSHPWLHAAERRLKWRWVSNKLAAVILMRSWSTGLLSLFVSSCFHASHHHYRPGIDR